jgi:alginate O-acetyltransferase complex protein AlgI
LRLRMSFDENRVVAGLRLMLWGLFQKVVIADQLAFYVNAVYANPSQYSGMHLITATLFFAFQIYCDFSGYSDIAIGASRTMGFDIASNFERPYFSKSISEFWRRWHISLSTWFRDYIYIPLGGRRVARWRWYLNLFITCLIAGLWHGANMMFVIWGSIHAFYMVFGMITSEWRRRILVAIGLPKMAILHDGIRMVTTFILVCIGWVFFRAQNIQGAIHILRNSLTGLEVGIPVISGFGGIEFFCCVCMIGIMEFIHFRAEGRGISEFLSDLNIVLRWGLYLFLVMTIILFSYTEQYQFIYFQF